MPGYIPEHIISDISDSIDIVSVIGDYVPLKRVGRNYVGLCPFHSEKTPSFTVSPDKQMWYCFGCGEGGDVYTFLMKHLNLTFPEAVSQLAEAAGITLPEEEAKDPQEAARQSLRQRLFEINRLAARWYYANLRNLPEAEPAREYLRQRGLSEKIQSYFGLGYAPDGWDGLLKHLTRQGYKEEDIAQAGLILKRKDNSGYYDRFRGRIMFPILDHQGRVMAFGGRVVGDGEPKYLNSPETPVFHKGRSVYGLNWAAGSIRRKNRVIVVEGYMDVISAHRFGVTNAVASLGTAFTSDQGRLLMRYSENISIAYDADTAGAKATLRGLNILQSLGARVRVAQLPQGMDPDDYLRRHGQAAFEQLVGKQSLSLMEYKLEHALTEYDSGTIEGKAAIVRSLLPDLAGLKSAVEREEYMRLIASRLDLSEEAVFAEFNAYLRNSEKSRVKKDKIGKNRYNNSVVVQKGPPVRASLERELLHQVLLEPQRAKAIQRVISLDGFQDEGVVEVLRVILKEGPEQEFDWSQLMQKLSEAGQKAVAHVMVADENRLDDFEHLLEKMYLFQLDNQLSELEEDLDRLEQNPNYEEIQKFLLKSFVFWQENDFLQRISIKRH